MPQVPIKSEVKYLGICLDQKLKWKTHNKAKEQHQNEEELSYCRKISADPGKQAQNIQSYTKTCMDIQNRTMRMC